MFYFFNARGVIPPVALLRVLSKKGKYEKEN